MRLRTITKTSPTNSTAINHKEVTSVDEGNQVKRTSNYDQFSFLEANREQNRGHVEALKRAFDDIGNLTRVQPILVNDRMQIIDGQHRFIACQELGEPIYYTQVPGLGVEEARSINILHRGWTSDDYAKSYAATGDPNYRKYLQLREEYPFGHAVTLMYIIGGEPSGMLKAFRRGEMVIEDEAEVRRRLDRLAEVTALYPAARTTKFASALLKIMRSEHYDHKRMLSKIRQYGDNQLRKMLEMEDNLRQIEAVYNYNQPESSRVRLY